MHKDISNNAVQAIKNILWMARRYADGRQTYAPVMFNDAYDLLRTELGDVIAEPPDKVCPEHPYATDGGFDVVKGRPHVRK